MNEAVRKLLEAIGLGILKIKRDCNYGITESVDKSWVTEEVTGLGKKVCQALALLRDEPCSECGGSGEVRKEIAGMTDYTAAKIPCPRGCQPARCPFNSPCIEEARIQPLLDDSGYYIYCLNCGRHTDTCKTEIEAITTWNAIAEPKPDDVEFVAELRDVIRGYRVGRVSLDELDNVANKAAARIETLEKEKAEASDDNRRA